jgi:hypothetical protein
MIFPCVPWIDFNIFTILRNERGNKALLENNIPWSFVFFFVPVQWRQFMEYICQQGMHLVSRVHAKLKNVSAKKVTGHA